MEELDVKDVTLSTDLIKTEVSCSPNDDGNL